VDHFSTNEELLSAKIKDLVSQRKTVISVEINAMQRIAAKNQKTPHVGHFLIKEELLSAKIKDLVNQGKTIISVEINAMSRAAAKK